MNQWYVPLMWGLIVCLRRVRHAGNAPLCEYRISGLNILSVKPWYPRICCTLRLLIFLTQQATPRITRSSHT